MSESPRIPPHGARRRTTGAPQSPPTGNDDAISEASERDVSDFSDNLPEEFVESILGEEQLPRPRRNLASYLLSWLRIALRLIFPRANQPLFAVGFWGLRAIGLAIVFSWLYFGLGADRHFDALKLQSGMIVFLTGPLALRAIEFLLENIALRGVSRNRWRDFWSFRRMMTPRSIQTVFFLGFWTLVGMGAFEIAAGLRQMIAQPRLRQSELAELLPVNDWDNPRRLIQRLRNPSDPQMRKLYELLPLETRRILRESPEGKEPSEPLIQQVTLEIYTALGDLLPREEQTDEARPGEPGAPPSAPVVRREPMAGKPTSGPGPFARILKGLLLLILGPIALRFTCESIILFFRINETLTDISRQIERLNRRLVDIEERQDETAPSRDA